MPTRLLVLEDDDGIRTALRLLMEDEGYDVSEHADARGALDSVKDAQPDLMLVDLTKSSPRRPFRCRPQP